MRLICDWPWHSLCCRLNRIASEKKAEIVVLPLVPVSGLSADCTSATDLPVELGGMTYQACRGDFVVRLVTNGAIVIHTQRLKSDPGGNLLS